MKNWKPVKTSKKQPEYYTEDEVDPTFLKTDQRRELALVFRDQEFIRLVVEGSKVFGQCILCAGNKYSTNDHGVIATYHIALLDPTPEMEQEADGKWIGYDGLDHLFRHHNKRFKEVSGAWMRGKQEMKSALKRLLESKL